MGEDEARAAAAELAGAAKAETKRERKKERCVVFLEGEPAIYMDELGQRGRLGEKKSRRGRTG